jgi:flagellar biosynthetic protein FliQ
MDAQEAIDLGREAIRACMMIGGPILVISLLVGLAIGMMQAMTQVQDQTVSFVPKLLIVMVGIAICLPWLSDRMLEFSHDMLSKPMMMAHGSTQQTVHHSANFVPVAWPSPQPDASIAPLNPIDSSQAPVWFDPSIEQPEREIKVKSPFQLPHYRFSRKPTDDLEG